MKTRVAAGNQFRPDSLKKEKMASHGALRRMTSHQPHQAQLTLSVVKSLSSKTVDSQELTNKDVKTKIAAGYPLKKNLMVLHGVSKKTRQTHAPM